MKKLFKIVLLFILLSVFFLAAAIPVVNFALKSEEVRNGLLHILASSLDGKLHADVLTIALDNRSLNISSSELKGSLLNNALKVTLPNSTLKISYRELIQGSFFPDTFQADSPNINYSPQSAVADSTPVKQLNWSGEVNALLKKILDHGAQINITEGTLVLASTTLSKLFIQTSPADPSTVLNVRTDILHRESVIPLEITGKCSNPYASSFTYDFDVQASSIPINVLPASQDLFFSDGTADFSGKLGRSGESITLNGSFNINNLDMTVGWTSENGQVHQEKSYHIPNCTLALQGGLHGRKIHFPSLDLMADDFHLVSSFILDFDNINNPFMELRLSSDEMELATLKMLLPDPLINDWTTRTIFPRLENGTARLTDFVLAGTLDDIGKLDEPEHSHCLSWAGVLHNIDTFYNDHIPLARVHSAHLSMDGGLLKIKELSGESGNSVLTRGNLTISGLYNPASILSTDVQGSFSLTWLNKLVKGGLLGEDLQQLLSHFSSISGQVNGGVNLSLALTADDVTLETLDGKGTVASMDMKLNNLLFPLKMKTADYIFGYPDKSFITGKGTFGKSTFNGTLNMAGDIDSKREFKLNIQADLDELKKILTDNQTIHALAPCVSSLPIKTEIILDKETITASGSLDFGKSKPVDNSSHCEQLISHNQLLRAEYSGKYDKKQLDINKVALHARDGSLQFSGGYKIDQQPPATIKNMKLKATGFYIQALSILLPEQKKWLKGFLDAELKASQITSDTIWSSLAGSFNLKSLRGSFAQPEITVNNVDLTGSLDQGLIEIKGTDIRLAHFNLKHPLTFHADLQNDNLWKGTVRIYGYYLDLTTISSLLKKGKTDFFNKLPIEKIRIIAGADHIRYRNIIFSPLLMQSHITADKIIISKGLLELDNDYIWLTGSQEKDEILYKAYFTIQGKPMDILMDMMGIENNIITGSLDIKGKLSATLSPSDTTFFESISGPIYIDLKGGTIESSSIFIKILDLISLENIFNKKDILEWRDSYKFDSIKGIFDLKRGMFTTNSLLMDASAFDIFGEGQINLFDDTIDMEVKLAPFGTLDKIFSSIPFLGYVLTGKSKSLFDFILSVKGKIKNPNIEYKPLAGTIESLSGYVQRLVSGRENINKEVNSQLKVDLTRKNTFIMRMEQELAPLQ